MKITAINATNSKLDFGLSKVIKIIMDTLTELGVEVVSHDLNNTGLCYYKGEAEKIVVEITNDIRQTNGLLFFDSNPLICPSGLMQTFLEHLTDSSFKGILENKNCMLVVVSEETGERRSLENFSNIINYLGGFDSVRIGLNSERAYKVLSDDVMREIIERQAEDFYRIVNQSRRYFIPSEGKSLALVDSSDFLTLEESEMLMGNSKPKLSVDELYEKLSLDKIDESQEDDIKEIAQFYSSKLVPGQLGLKNVNSILTDDISEQKVITPRTKTIRQMTQSLPHYFQPQLSGGLNAVIQLNISGEEAIKGYISIHNTECSYDDGQQDSPDLTILTDDAVWGDILKGKLTAQKAFLVGKLKVRGNFIMLNKFDQLFKI